MKASLLTSPTISCEGTSPWNRLRSLWLYSPLDREAILKDVLTYGYMAVPLANSLLWAINTPALGF